LNVHSRAWRARTLTVAVIVIAGAIAAPLARADGPGSGTPTVVSVGDSYISGEAGRWAGNASSERYVDALGPTAYDDNASGTAETIPGCHRSKSNETVIAVGTQGEDLACSGATTATQPYSSGGNFKPGLDLYDDGHGHQGQAKLLQSYATTHNVTLVTISIGGNDYNFAGIVTDCVADFLDSPSWWPNYCNDDSTVTSEMTSSSVSAKTAAIKNAILNVNTAMRNAGYASSQFSILVQDYPSPIPNGDDRGQRLLHPGGPPSGLPRPARAAQLHPPGVQRRRDPRRDVRAVRDGDRRLRGSEDDALVVQR
jgi:hypothetical protein